VNGDAMILLVGEQPAPNLLPLRHYDPAQVALVHTELTRVRAERLAKVIEPREALFCKTGPFQVDKIKADLSNYLAERAWTGGRLVFNLTGGTKPMAIAAYEVARQMRARAFYYRTQGRVNEIHPYRFNEGGHLVCESPVHIEDTLTLDDYLRLYVGEYTEARPKDRFEKMVEAALRSGLPEYELKTSVKLLELSGNVEVDLLVRYGNQVAVFEIKQRAGKKGIDQLNGVTDQRTLGTYTRRILVSAAPIDKNNLELAKAYRIQSVVVPSGLNEDSTSLTETDARQLIEKVKSVLEPRS